ncbi:hypothetical protein BDZ89DRAFT_1169483 [Hymenopellis radicata]|nr:hypothetical protein BDZ89DRAFT_1169483 [Hymenopellis radicata]
MALAIQMRREEVDHRRRLSHRMSLPYNKLKTLTMNSNTSFQIFLGIIGPSWSAEKRHAKRAESLAREAKRTAEESAHRRRLEVLQAARDNPQSHSHSTAVPVGSNQDPADDDDLDSR